MKRVKEKSVSKAPISKPVDPIKKEREVVKEEVKTASDQINSDMLALGLESNIPKFVKNQSNNKGVRLNIQNEVEKRKMEKSRLNIVVIGM